ncbi:hypothetical protein QAD02_004705 [Eretmocerus hayati]|uniref:Uncharacterized protein n=1 Tax=Eretmocerus hayati TaxID=131215 RepID=A0ACC2NRH8_9HYME|nr:hypothetical protein QAD02_004705 [Eretmocerus hayati]
MIDLNTPGNLTKLKMSPKKGTVHTPKVQITEDDSSGELIDSDVEEGGIGSPDVEIDSKQDVEDQKGRVGEDNGDQEDEDDDDDKQSSSGADGDESDADDGIDDSGDGNKTIANPGWADAMKKILNTKKPKKKKTIVLSKAKKLNEVIPKPQEKVVPFEVETEAGEIKVDTIKVETAAGDGEKSLEQKKRKRKESLGIRVKPNVLDREREKRLQRIATNGVVQLFNAVRQQQKEIEEKLVEAGPLERKREKAMKNIDRRAFLDSGIWNVLRDDFVMGAKLKDWNKESSEDESSAPEEMDSD